MPLSTTSMALFIDLPRQVRTITRCVMGFACVLVLAAVAGCSTLTSTPAVRADAGQGWALLPMNNLSATPQADAQAMTMLETQLRTRGVQQLAVYAPLQSVSLRTLLDPARQFDEAMSWARQNGYRYARVPTRSLLSA